MHLLASRRRPSPNAVAFDVYWRFAHQRQCIYLRRLTGQTRELTDDPVLAVHRFTNPYRATDRVSQYLITEVIYDRERLWTDTFVRILVFKMFNRIDTWRRVVDYLGEVDAAALKNGHVDQAIARLYARQPIYSAAYVMPPPRTLQGPKYIRHLSLVRSMLEDMIPERIAESSGMREAYSLLASYDSLGPFLAYQFVTDLNYSPNLNFNEDEFVALGPGALRGLSKCFHDLGDYTPQDVIKWVADGQHCEFSMRDLEWHNLWGRDLQLIDVQNLFCEVDKYTRAAYPKLAGQAPQKRIKQRYSPNQEPLTAWFPPKWGINSHIPSCFCYGSAKMKDQPSLL